MNDCGDRSSQFRLLCLFIHSSVTAPLTRIFHLFTFCFPLNQRAFEAFEFHLQLMRYLIAPDPQPCKVAHCGAGSKWLQEETREAPHLGNGLVVLLGKRLLSLPSRGAHIIGLHFIRAFKLHIAPHHHYLQNFPSSFLIAVSLHLTSGRVEWAGREFWSVLESNGI